MFTQALNPTDWSSGHPTQTARRPDLRPESELDAPMRPTELILRPEEVGRHDAVGGKVRSLARLTRAGFAVPRWFVLLPQAFYSSLSSQARRTLRSAESPVEAGRLLEALAPADDVLAALAEALSMLAPHGEPVAVRSSAQDEDGPSASFAGQLSSHLRVEPRDVADRVVAVWRSAFSERVQAYLREAGLVFPPLAPAVLIQRMVDAESSGVAFSADPVSARRSIAVVTAARGFGTALVTGTTDADTWQLDQSGRIVARRLAAVDSNMVLPRADGSAREGAAGPVQHRTQSAIDDQTVVAAAAMARQAERLFGSPQDIEWAIERDRLYILQSRPISTLAARTDPDRIEVIWDNSNIAENYSGVTTPLTFSFARSVYDRVYRSFGRLMGAPAKTVEDNAEVFKAMIGLVNGRIYYNMLNWYRLLSWLPGFRLNRQLLEQMLGVQGGMPGDAAPTARRAAFRDRIAEAGKLVRVAAAIVRNHVTLRRRVRRFHAALDDALGDGHPDLSVLTAHDLAVRYRDLERRLNGHYGTPALNDFFVMVFHGLLRRLAARWFEGAPDATLAGLLSLGSDAVPMSLARRLRRMAVLARERAGLVALLCEGSLPEVESELVQFPELDRQYHDYVDRFGDRCADELKLESLSLREDPLPLLRSIGYCARTLGATGDAGVPSEDDRRSMAPADVDRLLGSNPLKHAVIHWTLKHAAARIEDRENLRFARARVFGRVRQIVLELGKRLAMLDLIAEPRDVFFLEIDELLAVVEGSPTTADLKGLVALRKREFEGFQAITEVPDRILHHGLAAAGDAGAPATGPIDLTGDARRGIGCSPGTVRGPVRIVDDPNDARLEPGHIIVARQTDPGWVMLFPSAAGLLVERGNLLSHAAIVARELGLPTVVSVPGLTSWLEDGDWVEIDGSTGTIAKAHPNGRPGGEP